MNDHRVLQPQYAAADAWLVTGNPWRRRRPRAGGFAERRYIELRARWRKRVLPRFRKVLWSLLALAVAGLALPRPWTWLAGFLAGAMYSMWLWLRDAVPQHIERPLEGAQGEQKTEKELLPLEGAGWYIAHDLDVGRGNIDHLVVGRAGIFLLDSKNWHGEVSVADGEATVTPPDNPDAAWKAVGAARTIKREAAALSRDISELTGISTWVQPVVVVWAPFADNVVNSHGVSFVQGRTIRSWLEGRAVHFTPAIPSRLADFMASEDLQATLLQRRQVRGAEAHRTPVR